MGKKISVVLFTAIILFISAASFLQPYRSYSDLEKRDLAKFPEFNVNTVYSKSFMSDFDKYITDHIFARDTFMVTHTNITLLMGQNESGGVFLGKGCLIQDIASPDSEASYYKKNTDAVEDFANKYKKPVSIIVAPTAAEIERDKLPAFAQTWDQRAWLNKISDRLSTAKFINVADALAAHKNEYIYYRTDHHWTSLGAYYAYAEAGKTLGYAPLPLSQFNAEKAAGGFNGTLYNYSGYRSIQPDDMYFYHNKNGDSIDRLIIKDGGVTNSYNSIYFRNLLSTADKYNAFFNGNKETETIYTGKSGKKLLLIKDSYAHSLVPFLMNHYSEITMIDERAQVTDLNELVNVNDYDSVLFLVNADTFNSSKDIYRLIG